MKRLFVTIFCLIPLIALSAYADVRYRHNEQAGGFSLLAPTGWSFREFPGMKYKIAFGPALNSFSPNINVVDEEYEGSLKSYVNLNIDNLSKLLAQFKLSKRDDFLTTSGIRGEKLVTTSLHGKLLLRQTFYILRGDNNKYYVVACSVLASEKGALDSAFEESIKSFELIND